MAMSRACLCNSLGCSNLATYPAPAQPELRGMTDATIPVVVFSTLGNFVISRFFLDGKSYGNSIETAKRHYPKTTHAKPTRKIRLERKKKGLRKTYF